MNVTEELPPGTVTVKGTFTTDGEPEVRYTFVPAWGEFALRVNNPCEDTPPPTVEGLNTRDTILRAVTETVAVLETAPIDAVIVAEP